MDGTMHVPGLWAPGAATRNDSSPWILPRLAPPRAASSCIPTHKLHWSYGVLAGMSSGAMLAAGFYPIGAHWLAWTALVPLLVVLPRLSPGSAWVYGTAAGLVFYRIGVAWLFGVLGPLAALGIIVLAIWMGFAVRVVRMLMDRFGPAAMLWAVPLAFVGQEVLRCEGLSQFRFSFVALGYSQAHNHAIAQIASIGGVYLVSLVVVAVNAAIAWALYMRTLRACRPAAIVIPSVLLLAWVAQPHGLGRGPEIPVACIQGETCSYAEFARLTESALRGRLQPKLVVLPEHTIGQIADSRHPLLRNLSALAREYGAYICVGAHLAAEKTAPCPYENMGVTINPEGAIAATQAKSVPVPFFEDGNPARTQTTLQMPFGRAGVAICYDATFTDISRRLVAAGAELLVIPVMDPEHWPPQERGQHAELTAFRSIELRRWQLDAASSGISQIIDPTGRVVAHRTKAEGPGSIAANIRFESAQTLFTRGGHLFAGFVAILFLLATASLTWHDWSRRARGRSGQMQPSLVAPTP
jgi:apolipoprotein N-acyltransferase